MKHRRLFVWSVLALAPAWVAAQSDWARVAVPTYNATHVMQGLHGHWTAPRAEEFAAEAQGLVPAIQRLCEAPGAEGLRAVRQQWRSTTTAWERLSAVALGPVIERRSMRQIDFTPTRPALLEKAIAAAPRGAAAMERIGTPAKGLPALEWLLWTRPALLTAAPASPACRYAVELAAEVDREAAALKSAFRSLADRKDDDWTDEAAVAGMNEFVNQWVGGIERLRWPQIEKPLRSGAKGDLPRAASGSTATSWAAEWSALQALAVFKGQAAPAPGEGLVPIETWLRGRGLNPLADRLLQTTQRVDRRLKAAAPATGVAPQAAPALDLARELAALKRLAEAELAPALEVSIGFSDADGD